MTFELIFEAIPTSSYTQIVFKYFNIVVVYNTSILQTQKLSKSVSTHSVSIFRDNISLYTENAL
jgi:hypothetical protein